MEKIAKMEIIQTIDNANTGEMCRACFEKCGEYKMLFENAENIANRSLGDVFFDVVKIEISPDAQSSSPNRICLPCSKELISAYNFIQKSQQSHNRFLDYLRSQNIKPSDCLSEFPIDIPSEPVSSDLLQIKVEDEIMTDYTYPQDDEMFASSCSDSESDDEPLLNKKDKLNKMQCTYCSRVFKRLDFLQNHQKKHEEEIKKNEGASTEVGLKFTCDDCGLSCTSKLELKSHRIANHPARIMSTFPYGKFTEDAMKTAVDLVNNGMSLRRASEQCQIAHQTLARYVRKYKNDSSSKMAPNYSVNKIFTDNEEEALAQYIIKCAKMFYGLPILQCRKVAYEMAVTKNKKRPKNWDENEMAGLHWFANFRQRHPNLSLRTPEGCSLSRATSFNRHNVQLFFTNLKDVLSRSPNCFESGSRIYNMDETSSMTIQRPQKVLAEKGIKQVSKVTSAERGTVVTTCCTISATGQYIPPVMIFPRTHFKDRMITGAPSGTIGLANPSGRMNSQCFFSVIQHFVKFTSTSMDNPTLLIIDNHESHINIAALDWAKENGITILTVPPHSTNKLQPLDVGVYAPFKTAYNSSVDTYLMQNPGKTFTIYNVAASVGYAFEKSMTPSNIISSFKKTGIFPFDEELFTDVDFMCTERSEPENASDTFNTQDKL